MHFWNTIIELCMWFKEFLVFQPIIVKFASAHIIQPLIIFDLIISSYNKLLLDWVLKINQSLNALMNFSILFLFHFRNTLTSYALSNVWVHFINKQIANHIRSFDTPPLEKTKHNSTNSHWSLTHPLSTPELRHILLLLPLRDTQWTMFILWPRH